MSKAKFSPCSFSYQFCDNFGRQNSDARHTMCSYNLHTHNYPANAGGQPLDHLARTLALLQDCCKNAETNITANCKYCRMSRSSLVNLHGCYTMILRQQCFVCLFHSMLYIWGGGGGAHWPSG